MCLFWFLPTFVDMYFQPSGPAQKQVNKTTVTQVKKQAKSPTETQMKTTNGVFAGMAKGFLFGSSPTQGQRPSSSKPSKTEAVPHPATAQSRKVSGVQGSSSNADIPFLRANKTPTPKGQVS